MPQRLPPKVSPPKAPPYRASPYQASPYKVSVIAPDLSGGGMTRVYLVGQVLQYLGYAVEIIGFRFGPDVYPPPPPDLSVTAVEGHRLPRLALSLYQLLQRTNGDLIYAIKPRATSFGCGLLHKWRTHRPLVLDIDDWEMSWFGGQKYRYQPTLKQLLRDTLTTDGALRDIEHPAYLKPMESLTARADAITVNNQFLQEKFGGHYLPNGKDTDLFDPKRYCPTASREKYGLSDYRVLMFPGTARPHKGIEDLLAALEQLNEPDLRLAIVGGRKPDNYEDELIRRWGQWIIKLPRFSATQMAEVVAAAHVVVVPQRDTATANAQFPIKLTDGMAMAKPILSTRVGDIPTILADTGYLVPPNCPEQIAQTLKHIFDHWSEAEARGVRARARCIQHYSVSAMAATLGPVLQRLLPSMPPPTVANPQLVTGR